MSTPAERPAAGPPAASWIEVSVETPDALADELAGALAGITGLGVLRVAGGEGLCVLRAYLPDTGASAALEERLKAHLRTVAAAGGRAPRVIGREPLAARDWGRAWKEHFRPTRVSRRVVVRPPWEDFTASGGETVLVIDPGMAFGTGGHQSTRLVLGLIDELYDGDRGTAPPATVLDVGTGTGILAMACARLGARRVLAVDNDPDALAAARQNVKRNDLAATVAVSGRELRRVEGPFELVTANIVHDTLAELAPLLAARVAPGGALLCAGILAGAQEESLRRIFGALGLDCRGSRTEGEWAALVLHRP